MRGFRVLGGLLAASIMVVACGSGGGGTGGSGGTSCSKTWKVGLVTDVGKLSDKSFNFDSYKGVQDAQADSSLCVQGKAIESSTPDDYSKNITQFVDGKYDMIIGVGFNLGDAITAAAKANPGIKFVLVDSFDFADKTPPSNLTGLLFHEDEPGFLAGALGALMSKSHTIGVVAGLETVPPVVNYVVGYTSGASDRSAAQYTDADDPKRLIELDGLLQEVTRLYLAGDVREALARCRELVETRSRMVKATVPCWRRRRPTSSASASTSTSSSATRTSTAASSPAPKSTSTWPSSKPSPGWSRAPVSPASRASRSRTTASAWHPSTTTTARSRQTSRRSSPTSPPS